MEEKLDEIIALLTQLPETLHSFMFSKGEDEADQFEEEPLKEDESENKEDESEKDLGTDYLDF